MSLLISRDKTILETTEGKARVDEDLSEFLKTPRVVVHDKVQKLEERSPDDDLIIHYDPNDPYHNVRVVSNSLGPTVNALWSGYRSCLTYDRHCGRWFRIKGVSLNPNTPETTEFEDGTFWIQGGQKLENLWYEKKMSEKFGRVLQSEGIEPVMKYKGMWKYPQKVNGTRPAASIYEVLGDTRLDELMIVLENNIIRNSYAKEMKNGVVKLGGFTEAGEYFIKQLHGLYEGIGFTLGRLKRLMDKSGQTWSCDSERSNAHIGNVVVYGNPHYLLQIGLVDFDASCDSTELSQSELKEIQEKEYQTIIQSAFSQPISPREIGGILHNMPNGIRGMIKGAREHFGLGFTNGYKCESRTPYSNIVFRDIVMKCHVSWRHGGQLGDLFELIKSRKKLTHPVDGVVRREPAREVGKSKKTENLNDVIRRHYDFEKRLINNKENHGYYIGNTIIYKKNDYGKKRSDKKEEELIYGYGLKDYNDDSYGLYKRLDKDKYSYV